ncbi:MAG: cysteine hydrolase [Gammaproteobacteria bacterium]|nr:cysteine hydrolase [Gammaproteobacteria bacterium]
MAKALILIDIQNDYFDGGSMQLVGMGRAAANAEKLLQAARERGVPRYHVQHISARPDATFFVTGTEGVEINASVAPLGDEALVQKNFPNAFRDTALHQQLKDAGVDELLICGAMTHMCIDATTRAAFDLGYRCMLAEDACATRDLQFAQRTLPARDVHDSFMAALSAPYARVMSTSDCLKEI